jgi:hypothetical protein
MLMPIIFGMIGMILGTFLWLLAKAPPPGTVAAQIMAEAIARAPRGEHRARWDSVLAQHNQPGRFVHLVGAQLATVLAGDRPVGIGHCRPDAALGLPAVDHESGRRARAAAILHGSGPTPTSLRLFIT